ncbi:MAG: hypothetical protein ACTSV2_01935 [Candidatus Thorarchaeota archaeon]
MKKGTVLTLVFIIQLFCIPSIIQIHDYSHDTKIATNIQILQEDEELDPDAPIVEFLSPSDGELLEYAPLSISYRVTNTSAIQNLYLIIDGRVREIADRTSPFIWQTIRSGEIILNLVCIDNLDRKGMAMITVRIITRTEISVFGILLAAIGLTATIGIGYKAINRTNLVLKKEELPAVEIVKVPRGYVIKSKLKFWTRHKS